MSTLQADPSTLNEFFNKTAERLVEQNATTDDDDNIFVIFDFLLCYIVFLF